MEIDRTDRTSGGKLIVHVGDATLGAARIAGARRGWSCLRVASLREAATAITARRLDAAIVMAERRSISIKTSLKFSDDLAESNITSAVSMLVAENAAGLIHLAERIPATPTVEPRARTPAILLHDDFAAFADGIGLRNLASDLAAGQDYRSVLAGDFSVLFLVGHSNGHDEGFHGINLCCHRGAAGPPTFKAFPCYYGAPCKFPSAQFARFTPDVLRVRKLVNLTCWGVSLNDQNFAGELSIGEGLMGSEVLETMITAIRAIAMSRSDLLALYHLINRGMSFGRAVALANKLRLARGERADLFCFGDPEGAIEGAVDTSECSWHEGPVVAGDVTVSGASEVAVATPPGIDASDKVVLVAAEPGRFKSGIALANQVFMSVADTGTPAKINLQLISASSPEFDMLSSVRQLASTIGYVEHLAGSIAGEVQSPGQGGAANLLKGLEGLRLLLLQWPFLAVRPGDVIDTLDISAAFTELAARLAGIGSAFAEMYAGLVSRGSNYLLSIPDEVGCATQCRNEADTCAGCGEPVDDVVVSNAHGQPSRVRGYCFCCGPLYNTAAGAEKWIVPQSELHAGMSSVVRINVRNPYGFAANANLVCALPRFGATGVDVVSGFQAVLPPTSSMPLDLKLDIPSGVVGGTYYLMAGLIVGTSISLLRRPVIVRGA